MPMNVRGLLGILTGLGAAALISGYLALPTPTPVPTLVGVAPAHDDVLTLDALPLRALPWYVTPATTPEERARALALVLRRAHPRLGPTVHRTLGGRPAVEYAYTDADGDWTGVATALFGEDSMILQDCDLDGYDKDARLAMCAQLLDTFTEAIG